MLMLKAMLLKMKLVTVRLTATVKMMIRVKELPMTMDLMLIFLSHAIDDDDTDCDHSGLLELQADCLDRLPGGLVHPCCSRPPLDLWAQLLDQRQNRPWSEDHSV